MLFLSVYPTMVPSYVIELVISVFLCFRAVIFRSYFVASIHVTCFVNQNFFAFATNNG